MDPFSLKTARSVPLHGCQSLLQRGDSPRELEFWRPPSLDLQVPKNLPHLIIYHLLRYCIYIRSADVNTEWLLKCQSSSHHLLFLVFFWRSA